MTNKKMTVAELRQHIIESILDEGVNFWNQEYFYDPRRDTVDELVKGAMKWYSFAKSSLGLESPSDPKFLKKLYQRMNFLGISDDVIEKVTFKLRLQTATGLKPVK